ncbi:MAG: dicarboxylate/amino acid:cation symporter [Paludibacteraceae bacterium]|nr:dicarboxylate/amino acid:cation symporter [Paludibacteraceae bacterium]
MKKYSQLPLYTKILLGMVAGVLLGYLFMYIELSGIISDWVQPWGTIFIRMLKLIAVPLVFLSLIKGVTGMKDIRRLSGLGVKTIGIYILTTLIAVMLGLAAVQLVKPGRMITAEQTALYKEKFNVNVQSDEVAALQQSKAMDFIVNMVPENILSAGSDNSAMLQVIFVALLFGIAIMLIDEKQTAPFMVVVDSLDKIILKIVALVMEFAPFGVLALMSGLIVDFAGDSSMFAALGIYALTVVGALLFMILLFYPLLLRFFTGRNIPDYLKSIFPIQLLAFSTSSSAATLPFTIEQSQKKLGISEEVASFVFPVGATINMDGTSCYQVIAIFFIAQIFGIDLSFAQMLTIVMLTVLASIGTPGVPGGSMVMTVMVMSSVGIPIEGLALIVGIDRPLDMLRTVVNVTGDTFVASVLDRHNRFATPRV